MSKIIQFLDTTYASNAANANEHSKVLDTLPSSDLVKLYNLIADNIGMKHIKKFADKATAVKRTWSALEAYDQWAKAEKEPVGEPKAKTAKRVLRSKKKTERKARQMYFVFTPSSEGVHSVKAEDSLRGQAVKLLKKGATFQAVVNLVREFDKDRKKGNAATVERRAYELVRIMHYYLGYGIRQSDAGIITIYTKK